MSILIMICIVTMRQGNGSRRKRACHPLNQSMTRIGIPYGLDVNSRP